MQCLVYRSTRRENTFLLTDRGDTFDHIPAALLDHLGQLEFAFEFELTAERKLVIADAATVLEQIRTHGYYLQVPESEHNNA